MADWVSGAVMKTAELKGQRRIQYLRQALSKSRLVFRVDITKFYGNGCMVIEIVSE